ncbi:MAG: PKD domain-containing protein, partial [Flavobacteriales bacterium]|nr:PKD domain-containing protein [Flavobacteriales bacterium]
MKNLYFFAAFCILSVQIFATVPGPGDIALTSMNADGSDDFSFVLLKDISGTTEVHFTDLGWDTVTNAFTAASEGIITWTYTGTLSAGTEVAITTPTTTPSASHGSASRSGSFSVSGGGDQILVYTGTQGSPSFVYAFSHRAGGFHGNSVGSSSLNTHKPPGLTEGVNAIATSVHVDNWQYDCTPNSGSQEDLLNALMDESNYNSNSTTMFASPACGFTVAPADPPPAIAITSQTNVLCFGDATGTMTATVTPGAPNYSYFWSNGASTPNVSSTTNTITGLAAGNYTVTVQDNNGLTATASATITEPPTAVSAQIVIDTNISCFGSADAAMTFQATGGVGSFTYSWTTGDITPSVSSIGPGFYSASVTDGNGCGVTDFININEPDDIQTSFTFTEAQDCFGAVEITMNSSQNGILYFLRDLDTDSVIDVQLGDGSGLTFQGDTVDTTRSYYVEAAQGQWALDFDGVNQYVNTFNTTDLNFNVGSNFTIETWIKLDPTTANFPGIIGKYEGANYTGWGLQIGNNGLPEFFLIENFNTATYIYVNGLVDLRDDTWHHVAVTYNGNGDGSGVDFYIDGEDVGEFVASNNGPTNITNNGEILVGAGHDSGTPNYFLNGGLDDIRVWSDVRTGMEVGDNMYSCLDGNETNLELYYSLQENVGDSFADGSSSGITGYRTNGPSWFSGSPSCSDCSEILDTMNITKDPPISSNDTIEECDSTVSPSGNQVWFASGDYVDTMMTISGCDSLIFVHALINHSFDTIVNVQACNGYISPNGDLYSGPSLINDTLTTIDGCDSVINVNLLFACGFGNQASFMVDNNMACDSLTVNFTNTSNTAGLDPNSIGYQWFFGDGGYAAGQNVSHTYNNTGTYFATLDMDTNGVHLASFSMQIDVKGITGVNPFDSSTVCPNEAFPYEVFTNFDVDSVVWFFDDSETGNGNPYNKSFSDTGYHWYWYHVYGECEVLDSQVVKIENGPEPLFTINSSVTEACPGDVIEFSTFYFGADSFLWITSKGDTSMLAEPEFVMDTVDMEVILKLNDCGSNGYDTIVIQRNLNLIPDANNVSVNPLTLCPQEELSIEGFEAGSYTWNMDDGSIITSNDFDYSYSDTGAYDVELILTNSCGNSDTSNFLVNVQYNPFNSPFTQIFFEDDFGADTLKFCPGETVEWDNFSSINGVSGVQYWLFGDGDSAAVYDTSHVYSSAGLYEVQFIMINNCNATDTAFLYVDIDTTTVPDDSLFVVPDTICPGEQVFFAADQGGNPLNLYSIWFGDGDSLIDVPPVNDTLLTDVTAIHTYASLGTYPIRFESTNLCGNTLTYLDTIVVTNSNSNPTLLVFGPDSGEVCPGDTAEFFAVGGTSFVWQWDDGTPNDSIQNPWHVFDTLGSYNVSVTISTGCGVDSTINFNFYNGTNSLPSANFSLDQFNYCVGDTIELMADDVDLNNTYSWDFGDGNSASGQNVSHAYAMNGFMNIELTVHNGCGSDVFNQFPSIIGIEVDTNQLDITASACDINTGSISNVVIIDNAFDMPYTYEWTDANDSVLSTSSNLFNLGVGSYTLNVISGSGCNAPEVVVDVPNVGNPSVPSFTLNNDTICIGDTFNILLGVDSGATAMWYTDILLTDSVHGDTIWNVALDSNATFYVTQIVQGCESFSTQIDLVVLDPTLTVQVDSNVSCNGFADGGASAVFSGSIASYTYSWNNGGNTSSINTLTAGTYIVTATDGFGCQAVDSVQITEPSSLMASTVVDSNVTCNGLTNGGATASASGGTVAYSYLWSNSAVTASITGVGAGQYIVTVTDANGCTAVDTAVITEPALLVASAVVDSNVTCNGLTNGGATASATGGTT